MEFSPYIFQILNVFIMIIEILNGKRPVTTEYALLLEAALGTSANIWLGLQADYNMQVVKQDKSFMKKLEKIRKIAAIF